MPKNSPFNRRKSRFRALKYFLTVTQKVGKLGYTPWSSRLKASIPEPSLFLLLSQFLSSRNNFAELCFLWLSYSSLIPAACSVTLLLNLCVPFLSRGLLSPRLPFKLSLALRGSPWRLTPLFLPPTDSHMACLWNPLAVSICATSSRAFLFSNYFE